jgi:hemolysin-activating ACP:hemolysin acyltransferase
MTSSSSEADAAAVRLTLHRPPDPARALGLAVSYLMTKPAFAKLRFGEWSRILTGQINRGHYVLVADQAARIRGFAGWGLTSEALAEAWIAGTHDLTSEECRAGDCVIVNGWATDGAEAQRMLVAEGRRASRGMRAIYYRRIHPDGRVRGVRLSPDALRAPLRTA